MFILYANKNQLSLRAREPVTSGSVNVYEARFEFSDDWDGLERTVVFRCGGESRCVLLDGTGQCAVPWEVLTAPGRQLLAGVYGTRGSELVLPTVWAGLGMVLDGAAPGEGAQPPTPDLWRQELDAKQDKLSGQPGQVVGFGEDGKAAAQDSDTLIVDHRRLTHRDEANQHPIDAISGLREALDSIPVPMTAEQLREILVNGGKSNG